jgi:pseudouridine synthase
MFQQGECTEPLTKRKEWLESFQFGPNFQIIESVPFDLDKEYDRFMDYNRSCIDKGYEGIMIKPQNGVYECKRSSLWLKVKPFIEVSLKVVAVEEGTGRNVGKLGALIVEGTDDGKFIHRMSSPKHHMPKVYEVTTKHEITEQQVEKLLAGVVLDDSPKPVKAAACEKVSETHLKLTLTEGKYHQVKRMLAAVGNRVEGLHRSAIGNLQLPEDLAPGQWRWILPSELEKYFKA